LYSSTNIIRVIKSKKVGCARHVESMRDAHKILLGKPEGKKRFRRPRLVQRVHINLNLKLTVCEDVHWIQLAQAGSLVLKKNFIPWK
jgi:hypothetical protein